MSIQDKIKATAKKLEGKIQEIVGEISDNREMQAKGKAKQAEGKISFASEHIKDKAKKALD